MRIRGFFPYMFLLPTLIILICLSIVPLTFSLYYSFWDFNIAFPMFNEFIKLGNYLETISDPRFHNSLGVTFCFVGGAVSLEFLYGFGLALLLNQKIKGKSIFMILIVVSLTAMPAAMGFIWKFLYNYDFGLFNYFVRVLGIPPQVWLVNPRLVLLAVILMDIWQWAPFVFLVLFAGLSSLPKEYLEAATVDGASSWQKFIHITLPMLKPLIVIVVLLRVIDAMKTFDGVFILTRGGPGIVTELVSLYIYKIGFKEFSFGYAAALSWLFLLIVIFLINVYFKALSVE